MNVAHIWFIFSKAYIQAKSIIKYQCSQSDKAFTDKQSLVIYPKTHTGDKYQCNQHDRVSGTNEACL